MEYIEFVCAVEKGMNMKLKGGVKAKVYTAVKNNGKEKKVVMVECPGVNISPTIYLEEFYEHFQNGEPLEQVICEILTFYENVKCEKSWDVSSFVCYDEIRSKVVFKVINTEKNAEFLKEVPYIPFLDLSIVFYVLVGVHETGSATMIISNEHMQLWKITKEELFEVACENVKRLIPAQLFPMTQIVEEMLNPVLKKNETRVKNLFDQFEPNDADIMYMLSNPLKNLGAACMVYPHVLEMAGEIIGEDFYVLPSSIHEVILVPECGTMEQSEMDAMVEEINATQVAEEEVLSDHAYYYEISSGQLILQQCQKC